MNEIEWYLDELFDQLAGTGAAGRRALIEAEYHLRASATDAMARGLPLEEAEHEAISRFGPAALVARKLRSAQGPRRSSRVVSMAWLVAGLAGCGLGAAYLLAACLQTREAPGCDVALSVGCYTPGMLATQIITAMTVTAAGAALLLSRWFVARYTTLIPCRRELALRARR